MKYKKAVFVCAASLIAALLFNAGIFCFQGPQKGLEFFTGYLIELSLSIDNLFVFFLIFSYFKVAPDVQNRILSWGVLGAQFLRAVFIFGGVALLKHFSWVTLIFGALLVFSGFKLFLKTKKPADLNEDNILRYFKKLVPSNLSSFWVVLIVVELADLIFAVDSIPAVLAVTKDPFIVYSSNIFAILGLRALYFIFFPVVDKFPYLHYTVAVILVFTGFKMLTDHLWPIPIGYALGFIVLVLSVSSIIPFFINNRKKTEGV